MAGCLPMKPAHCSVMVATLVLGWVLGCSSDGNHRTNTEGSGPSATDAVGGARAASTNRIASTRGGAPSDTRNSSARHSTSTSSSGGAGALGAGGTGSGKSSTSSTGGAATSATTVGGTSSLSSGGATTAIQSCGGEAYTVVWSDEFNGLEGQGVNEDDWAFDLGSENGGWGNSELEYYTKSPSNVAMDGKGHLVITARKEQASGKDYTSARLKTQGKHAWKYGRIEAKMKLPKGQGIWPALWMLGEDIGAAGWPDCGEIDIMENVGKAPNEIVGSLHGPGYSGGNPLTNKLTMTTPPSDAFHVYAIEWDDKAIRWYVDDLLYSTKTPADVPKGATWVYDHNFFVILNLAVGGTWPGAPDPVTTVFPQELSVDYIRVCQK